MLAYLGLGSNLCHPHFQIQRALKALKHEAGIRLMSVSSLYESPALSGAHQHNYLNAVCAIETFLTPLKLLDACQRIERNQGRRRREHWGSRTLDIDILLYGKMTYQHPRLTFPHVEMLKRRFVVEPLLEIERNITIPNYGLLRNLLGKIKNDELRRICFVKI